MNDPHQPVVKAGIRSKKIERHFIGQHSNGAKVRRNWTENVQDAVSQTRLPYGVQIIKVINPKIRTTIQAEHEEEEDTQADCRPKTRQSSFVGRHHAAGVYRNGPCLRRIPVKRTRRPQSYAPVPTLRADWGRYSPRPHVP